MAVVVPGQVVVVEVPGKVVVVGELVLEAAEELVLEEVVEVPEKGAVEELGKVVGALEEVTEIVERVPVERPKTRQQSTEMFQQLLGLNWMPVNCSKFAPKNHSNLILSEVPTWIEDQTQSRPSHSPSSSPRAFVLPLRTHFRHTHLRLAQTAASVAEVAFFVPYLVLLELPPHVHSGVPSPLPFRPFVGRLLLSRHRRRNHNVLLLVPRVHSHRHKPLLQQHPAQHQILLLLRHWERGYAFS